VAKEGKYIYCIIGTEQERNFGPIGLGGRGDEVLTIGYNDLSMVVSSHPMAKFVVNRENVLAHQRVVELVMNEFDSVLPVRFGTIASNAGEIRNLLDRRYREFKNFLKDMDHKIELGVKGLWQDMSVIFKKIAEDNKKIKQFKEKIKNNSSTTNTRTKIAVGRKVKQFLIKKKKEEAEKIVSFLKRASFDYRLNRTIGDEMFMNAAFLVDRGREKEFDNIMDDLSERYKNRVNFKYAGPLPVFNFVNIVIYPEEWEK
jgi:hypothetical protein